MTINGIDTSIIHKKRWLLHVIYWLLAALILLMVFSDPEYSLKIRLSLVSILILVSYALVAVINNVLIARYLFQGKLLGFFYLLIFVVIFTLWVNALATFLVLVYSAYYLPEILIPTRQDIVVLIAGNYIVVGAAVVIHFIKTTYKRQLEKIDIEHQKMKTEYQLNQVRLQLLQGQLHPHFLFNMLNNLYGVVKKDGDRAREIIIKLSALLEYMLYECRQPEVLLKKELIFIKNYIALEEMRHAKGFNVQFDMADFPDNYTLPPLLLFPFVENAFKHSNKNDGHAKVYIRLRYTDAQLCFEVENTKNAMIDNTSKKGSNNGNGIGLKNIKERLNILYQDDYELTIDDKQNRFYIKLIIKYAKK